MNRAALLLATLLFAIAAHGEMYKWVDPQGNVHYSDQPPPNVKAKPLNVQLPPSSAAPANAEKSLADQEMSFRKRRQEEQAAEKKEAQQEAQAKQKQDNCNQAQGYLRTLQAGGRIFTYDASGNRQYMDDASRQKAMEKAQKDVDQWCK